VLTTFILTRFYLCSELAQIRNLRQLILVYLFAKKPFTSLFPIWSRNQPVPDTELASSGSAEGDSRTISLWQTSFPQSRLLRAVPGLVKQLSFAKTVAQPISFARLP